MRTILPSPSDGYRHQLARIRRFRGYVVDPSNTDVEFQDFMWSFFQHCWHLRDWVWNDPACSGQKTAVKDAAHASTRLVICQDICNGTKHLKLDQARSGSGAHHSHVDTAIEPGGKPPKLQCVLDDGHGNAISGRQLMDDCIVEWEKILTAQGLSIQPP